jgi:glycosyltransferase involved in cell wall biosynthesis
MKKSNILIYFLDSHAYILPVLIGRMLRKKIIFLLAASISGSTKSNDNFFTTISIFSESMNFKLADYIIVYSPILVEKWNLQKYTYKILIAHEHFLCLDKFRVKINLNDRLSLFGYVGRLSGEKGVENFVQALPAILGNQRKDFHVMIGGDGPLRSEIETCLLEQGLAGQVEMTGWISHEDLPNYLNRMKLLVIPSYSEGLPNIMLEAMACGTPVLSTPVGAIPDIIKDGETGYIMQNNTPLCITENIIRALGDSNLENIAMNAQKLVEKEFTFESTVMQWKNIFDEI